MADITAKIKLDGEAQFKRGMADAAKGAKSLESQLKLTEKEFKDTGNAEAYMQQKGELLTQKLDQQKRGVDTAKQALQQLKKQGFEDNSKEVLEWKGKLAEAELQVKETTDEIDKHRQGLDKAGTAYKNAGDKADKMGDKMDAAGVDATELNQNLKDVGKGISWQNVTDGIGSINQAIDNGVRRVIQWGKELWNLAVDATYWADDLVTLSQQTGIDTTTLQQWNYASRFIDTDVQAIIGARNKLTKAMTTNGLQEILEGVGITTTDANGGLRESYDLMWDVLELLGRMDNETERDNLAMNVFGRSYKDLMPLILAGREAWDAYGAEAPLVSEENIDKLTTANDAIERMNARLETMKTNLLAELAPVLTIIADSISDAVGHLETYLQSEEGQQLLKDLGDAAVKIVDNLTKIDWDKTLKDAAGYFQKIKDVLLWIADNKDKIVGALEAIAGARIFGAVVNGAATVGKVGNGLMKLLGFGGAAATTGAATGTGGTVAATAGRHGLRALLTNPAFLGTAAGMALMMGGAYAVGQRNQYIDIQSDMERYSGDPREEAINRAAYMLTHGNGSSVGDNGANAAAAMTYLAVGGSPDEWVHMFDYVDRERGETNFLTDILEGTDWAAGDNPQLMAAIYRSFARAYGDISTDAGAEALAQLPQKVQDAIVYGKEQNLRLIAAGSELDDTALFTYLTTFFQAMGKDPYSMEATGRNQNEADAAANGATTAYLAGAEAIIARGYANGTVLTRPESVANGGGAQDPAETAEIVASALSGVTVEIDGRAAGRLIAPTVSQILSRQMLNTR